MRPQMLEMWKNSLRLVPARRTLLRVTAVPVEATWEVSARMTAMGLKVALTALTRTNLPPTLGPLGVSPLRAER